MEILQQQYKLAQGSRLVLFGYLRQISTAHYLTPLPVFGNSSLRDLQVHVINTYVHWLDRIVRSTNTPYFETGSYATLTSVENLYSTADQLVQMFLNNYGQKLLEFIDIQLSDSRQTSVTPLALFSHVVTHEYHHKGQILSMSCHLGYTPIDTDLIRT